MKTTLLISASCLCIVATARAQGYRLNDPLARSALGEVSSFRLDPTGTHVLFLADMDPARSSPQVYSAPVDGSTAAVQLTDVPSTITLSSVGAIADGSRVLYLGRFSTTTRLYVVPTDGSSEPRQLSGTMLPDGAVLDYLAAPIGKRVVFRADKEIDGVFELYSRPADLSAEPVKLSGPMVNGGGVAEYRISPDGSRVVYRADQSANEVYDLYSAPIDGSAAPVRLNLSRPFADVEHDFAIAFDSLGVLYRADQDADQVVELYAVRIDGSAAPMKRNGALVSGGDVLRFELSSLDDRLLYRADQVTNEVYELFSTRAISGGTPVRLNGPLVPGGDVVEAGLTPDARYALYRADQETDGLDGLFVAPADGSVAAQPLSVLAPGETLRVSALPVAGGRALYTTFDTTGKSRLYSAVLDRSRGPVSLLPAAQILELQTVLADGTVLAVIDLDLELPELFAVPIDGSAPARQLTPELVSYGRVFNAVASGDGSRIVYSATQSHVYALEVYSVPTGGGSAARISPPVPLGPATQGVYVFAASKDGTMAAYTAPEESTEAYELFAVATDGQRNSVRLNLPFGFPVAGIGEFAISPDSSRVAYGLVRNNSTTIELHVASTDRSGTSVRLDVDRPSPNSDFYQIVDSFAFTPDSSHVVYLADQTTDEVYELFLVPSDGSAPPTPLHPPGPLESDQRFELSPDGAWVVYWRNSVNGTALFSQPLDGHQPPARLSATFASGGNLGGDQLLGFLYPWTITPDARVVYYADQDTNDVTELYVVPMDGSQAPVRLNAALVAGGDVATDAENLLDNPPYVLSPDGTRVVYRADQRIDGQAELFSVPSTGGAAVRINGPLVSGGNVGHFAVDPSSARVLYVADQESDDVSELYSAPLDGSSAAVKLSGTLAPGGSLRVLDQRPFAFGSGGRVVFLADASVPFQFELWSVPIDGSSAPLRCSGALASGSYVRYFALTSDGTGVVYAANPAGTETFELFHAPLDASTEPRRISAPMVAGGSLLFDLPPFLVLANDLVLYRADQDSDDSPELYATRLDWQRGPRNSSTPTGSKTIHR